MTKAERKALILSRVNDPSPTMKKRFQRVAMLQVHGPVRLANFIDKRNGNVHRYEAGEPITDIMLAAQAAGVNLKYARHLRQSEAYHMIYASECEMLRRGERAANIRTAIKIRDKAAAENATAAQQTVSLKAAEYLDGGDGGKGDTNITVNVTPGYAMDLSGDHEPARKIIDVTPEPADEP